MVECHGTLTLWSWTASLVVVFCYKYKTTQNIDIMKSYCEWKIVNIVTYTSFLEFTLNYPAWEMDFVRGRM